MKKIVPDVWLRYWAEVMTLDINRKMLVIHFPPMLKRGSDLKTGMEIKRAVKTKLKDETFISEGKEKVRFDFFIYSNMVL